MPDTVPGSNFDAEGICQWCRSGYPNYKPAGRDELGQRLRSGLRSGGAVDCIVGVSGGKDSSFALWAMKYHYGLRVEAFTYDHSGVTDAARQNVRSVCANLGVPLTVCSLPEGEHRETFREYFEAYIRHPTTVSAGLTCVACKHLHLFGTELAVRRNAPFVVWAKCPLEDLPFIAMKGRENSTTRDGLLKGSVLLTREVLQAPSLAAALLNHFAVTAKGCLALSPSSVYLKIRYPSVQQIALFEYWPWNPKEIYATLTDAGWKKPTDTPNDWHSDCSFHVLKEYMFQKLLGVSYTDGFLSNQIRSGLITREEALLELKTTKHHLAKALPESIRQHDLEHLMAAIDASCFSWSEVGEPTPPEAPLTQITAASDATNLSPVG